MLFTSEMCFYTPATLCGGVLWFYAGVHVSIYLSICLSVHLPYMLAGLDGSVGGAARLETRRSRIQPMPRSATFFHGDWSWNIFYGHSLSSADSRRVVVSFWRKNVHNTG